MACRTAGRLCWGGGPPILFPPFGLIEPAELEESVAASVRSIDPAHESLRRPGQAP
jgi:hypothetical protein